MNAKSYWIATALVAGTYLMTGAMDLAHAPPMADGMARLGYPPYVMSLLGVWKILGAAALLAPGLPRVKEWAYAGITFNLTGAAFSHVVSGDPAANVAVPLVLLGLAAISWALRPQSRRLAGAVPAGGVPSGIPAAARGA